MPSKHFLEKEKSFSGCHFRIIVDKQVLFSIRLKHSGDLEALMLKECCRSAVHGGILIGTALGPTQ